jgi:hypothetical protein
VFNNSFEVAPYCSINSHRGGSSADGGRYWHPASHQRQVKLVTPDGPATRAVTVSAEHGCGESPTDIRSA